MMFRALRFGMTEHEFWRTSPRAVATLARCAREAAGLTGGAGKGGAEKPAQRLTRIPR